jgi:hypothetical protein
MRFRSWIGAQFRKRSTTKDTKLHEGKHWAPELGDSRVLAGSLISGGQYWNRDTTEPIGGVAVLKTQRGELELLPAKSRSFASLRMTMVGD